jgi:DNA-binding transcriptional ArsR family regulator
VSIEEVLSSKGRVKILRILAQIGELNISEIARRAGLNYVTTNQHLLALESQGIIKHKKFGRIRIFRFDKEKTKARILKQMIDQWEQTKEAVENHE